MDTVAGLLSNACIAEGLEVISVDIPCDSDCVHAVYNWNDCSGLTRLSLLSTCTYFVWNVAPYMAALTIKSMTVSGELTREIAKENHSYFIIFA